MLFLDISGLAEGISLCLYLLFVQTPPLSRALITKCSNCLHNSNVLFFIVMRVVVCQAPRYFPSLSHDTWIALECLDVG